MTIKLVCCWRTLGYLAKALVEAERSGDQESISRSRAEHDAYLDLCIEADEVILGHTIGGLL